MNCLQTNGRTTDNRRSEKLTPVLRSAKRGPANVRRLNNISDVNFYCSVGERSRALALLNAAQYISIAYI